LSSSLVASYVLSPLFGSKGLADRTEHGLASPELFTTLLNWTCALILWVYPIFWPCSPFKTAYRVARQSAQDWFVARTQRRV